MKKVFILLVFINFSFHAQNNCDVLSPNQLKSIENKKDYESLKKLGLSYFQAFKDKKKSNEKSLNLSKATEYLKQAYAFGNGAEFSKVACYYGLTILENKDYKNGFSRIKASAEQGYLPAMFYLGKLYELGTGGSADNKKAEKNYLKAASQFNEFQALACDRLGRLYHNQLKDDKTAALWLYKAVQLGYTRATYLLLNIDSSYGEKIKKITSMDEQTQRNSGLDFGKDGNLYLNKCHKVNPNFEVLEVTPVNPKSSIPEKLTSTEINHLEKLGRNGSMESYQKLLDYNKKRGDQNGINRYVGKMKELAQVKKNNQRKIKSAAIRRHKSVLQGLVMAGALYDNSAESTKYKKEAYDFVENVSIEDIHTVTTPRHFKEDVFKVHINKSSNDYYLFVLMDFYASNPYRTKFVCTKIVKVISNQVFINDAKKNWVREVYSRTEKRNDPLLNWKEEPNGY